MIETSTVVVRAAGMFTAPVDDELVILNPDRDNYLGLDDIGKAVWDLIENPVPIQHVCARLADDFDGTPSQIQADVLSFFEELVGEGVVLVVD